MIIGKRKPNKHQEMDTQTTWHTRVMINSFCAGYNRSGNQIVTTNSVVSGQSYSSK